MQLLKSHDNLPCPIISHLDHDDVTGIPQLVNKEGIEE